MASFVRPLLHLLSLVLALPGIALAAAFLIFGKAIAAHSLLGFLGVLLDVFVWLLPWGLLACVVVLLALVVGGFSTRVRWLASSCVAALAVASSIVLLALTTTHDNFSPDQLPFFAPALVSATIGVWIAIREWPHRSLGHDRA